MVCLGNICRSPVADGLLRQKVKSAGLDIEVDSCGTAGYHIGDAPDSRSQANAKENGLDISMLRARQFQVSDFDSFDYIYCMDKSNLQNVLKLSRSTEDEKKVRLILEHTHPNQQKEVPDPYFGGEQGFQVVYNLLDTACDGIIHEIESDER
jgi:protein-tyrosine phosphatase